MEAEVDVGGCVILDQDQPKVTFTSLEFRHSRGAGYSYKPCRSYGGVTTPAFFTTKVAVLVSPLVHSHGAMQTKYLYLDLDRTCPVPQL